VKAPFSLLRTVNVPSPLSLTEYVRVSVSFAHVFPQEPPSVVVIANLNFA
jgi:hypothetical protein